MATNGTHSSRKVWLVTGASQGLGLALTNEALLSGHKVIATARNPAKARAEHPEVEANGGVWIQLDVVQPDTQARVDAAIREHGEGVIDVVVNNAGIDLIGTVEDTLYVKCLSSCPQLMSWPQGRRNASLLSNTIYGSSSRHKGLSALHACPKVWNNRLQRLNLRSSTMSSKRGILFCKSRR